MAAAYQEEKPEMVRGVLRMLGTAPFHQLQEAPPIQQRRG